MAHPSRGLSFNLTGRSIKMKWLDYPRKMRVLEQQERCAIIFKMFCTTLKPENQESRMNENLWQSRTNV